MSGIIINLAWVPGKDPGRPYKASIHQVSFSLEDSLMQVVTASLSAPMVANPLIYTICLAIVASSDALNQVHTFLKRLQFAQLLSCALECGSGIGRDTKLQGPL